MFHRLPVLVTVLVLALAQPGRADSSHTFFVPIAAHLAAAGGATWESDLRLYNATDADVTADLAFLRAGRDNSDLTQISVTVPAGQVLLLEDVVSATFGLQGYGAIRIQSSTPLVASSSTYNKAPFSFPGVTEPRRETFQIVAVDETEWSSTSTRVLFVANRFRDIEAGPSLRDSTTNVGILNPNPYLISVTASLTDEAGPAVLGTRTLTLDAYSFTQIVDLFDAFGASNSRINNALLSIGATRGVSAAGPQPAPVVAYAVRQTATSDTCGGLVKQADFLLAERVP